MKERAYLSMEGITKRFGSFVANNGVNFSVAKAEVHALLGENGAGKSTLMNILSGLYQMNEGHIYIGGQQATIKKPQDAKKWGVGMVYQHFMLVQAMTVVENVILSMSQGGVLLGRAQVRQKIADLSQKYGLDIHPDKLVSELSVGEQQRIEIIKVLCANASILILDEPTAVLTPGEAEGLFEIIRKLVQEEHTVIFISHKLKEVMTICDRITVLRQGKLVGTVNKADTTADDLGDYMVGRKIVMDRIPPSAHVGAPVLQMREVRCCGKNGLPVLDIGELTVHAGEILSIAGVDGNGQSELAKAVTGLLRPQNGRILVNGQPLQGASPLAYIQAGVAHIPEDRGRMGLVGSMSIYENLVLKEISDPPYSRFHGWYIDYRRLHSHALSMIEKYDIRTADENLAVGALSGGNAQKVILAREIESHAGLLVAVHPTRGLDVGASEFVHKEIVAAREMGCAVLLISADLDEILRLADRLAVLYEGRIMGYENPEAPNISRLSLMMAGKEAGDEEIG